MNKILAIAEDDGVIVYMSTIDNKTDVRTAFENLIDLQFPDAGVTFVRPPQDTNAFEMEAYVRSLSPEDVLNWLSANSRYAF